MTGVSTYSSQVLTKNILIVDDDSTNISILLDILKSDYTIYTAKNGEECFRHFMSDIKIDLILLDVMMPGMDGYEVCKKLKENPASKKIPVIFVTSAEKIENEKKGLEMGAVDYIKRPFDPEIVSSRVKIHIELASLREKTESERDRFQDELNTIMKQRAAKFKNKEKKSLVKNKIKSYRNIVGQSEIMQSIFLKLKNLSNVPSTVIITGESGTGKELAAQALHYGGVRRDLPFAKIACSDLSETLIESELFGHARGAYTGAVKARKGRFEMAGKGTVFLDEIGDIPAGFQKRLLRVFEERSFERVGENMPVPMKARVIAATHHDLQALVKTGTFRADLFYRLKVMTITLPPLRERKEDIPLLVSHFLSVFRCELNKNITDVSAETMKLFMNHLWPGNIRELKHVIEYACVTTESEMITTEDLPPDFSTPDKFSKNSSDEVNSIMAALREARWNKTKAAESMGISRRTFYRKYKKYAIDDICNKELS